MIPRILRHVMPEPNSGCWLWTGCVSHQGYALLVVGGKKRRVHRLLYEGVVGPIPDGLVLDHKCRVRGCVNPDHLEPVTSAENTRRGANATLLRGCCPRCGSTEIRIYKSRKRRVERRCGPCLRARQKRGRE